MEETHGYLKPETPFCMLVMGDFTGRENRTDHPRGRAVIAQTNLRPIPVDRDTLDRVLAKLGAEIHLSILGENLPPVCIRFSSLDDFHPDSLFQQLDIFQALKDTRKSLRDPLAAADMAYGLLNPMPVEKEETKSPTPLMEQPSGDLLDQIIEQSQPDDRKCESKKVETRWTSFLHGIVKPYLVPKVHPRQEEMINAVDAAAVELMRLILHHEAFQAVEGAWRGLNLLVSRLETDSQLTLSLLDVSKPELTADLSATDDVSLTALHKLFVDQAGGTAGRQPWAVVAGNYIFEKQDKDLELLGRMAKIAAAAGTCFISAPGDRFLCENSLKNTPDPDDWTPMEDQGVEENWQALRHLPEAANIGLVLPRMLLRLPYGDDTDPIDAFHLEEMPIPPVHKKYLWGNPCFAIILLLGKAFTRNGWKMRPGSVLEINSLPLHVFKKDGESFLTPCAETLISQRAAELIMEKGLMPLIAFLNQDMVRLGRFQSIADPPGPLAGFWGNI